MSTAAVDWAIYRAHTSEPAHKLVLLVLANHADRSGRGAYPSAGTIAEAVQLSLRTVQRYLAALEEDGLIVRGDQSRADRFRPRHRPVVYDLAMRQSDVSEPGCDTSPGGVAIRQEPPFRYDTGVVQTKYKPRDKPGASRGLLPPVALPPSPAALRASEAASCDHGAPPGGCAICRRRSEL